MDTPTMRWCNVAVTPAFSWPNEPVSIPFEGRVIVLSPATETLACRVALLAPEKITFDEGATILSRFLSRLAWANDAGIVEFFHLGTNIPDTPGRLGQGTYQRSPYAAVDPPQHIYLPNASTPEADLALALYREGLSVNSIPFKFLSLFKIFNVCFSSGSNQEAWINGNLHQIKYPPASGRLREVAAKHGDVGHYLYVQGRCTIAHAHSTPLVNPDAYPDRHRLEEDLPLLKELAALCVEKEFGVRPQSVFLKNFSPNDDAPELFVKGAHTGNWISYAPYASLV